MKLIEQAPLEMLELILMRAFVILYVRHHKTAIICAGERTFITLAQVCYTWWQTLHGWPQSSTPLWLKHQIVKQLGGQSLVVSDLVLKEVGETPVTKNKINRSIYCTNSASLPVRRGRGLGSMASRSKVCLWPAGRRSRLYSVSQKNIPGIFSCNSRKHCRIFIMFGTHVTEKVSNQ